MSASFDISASTGSYTVAIEAGLFAKLKNASANDTVIICDERFAPELRDAGCKTIALPADEKVKSLDHMPAVITELRRHGTSRGTHLIALGGGIVQDVAAFCASVYMRGLNWSYLPTTLLGMADSCIGGKSSINVGEYKNIVGTFYPPQRIEIDPRLAATLQPAQIVAGLCEAAKICFCRGDDAFEAYRASAPTIHMDEKTLTNIVTLSLKSKKWFVEIDEFDRAERLLLNFGHTFGHALEGATHYAVSHGVAVGIGILMEVALGRRMGLDYSGMDNVLFLEQHLRDLLGHVPDLKQSLAGATPDDLFDRFKADKKHSRDFYNVVMVDEKGRTILKPLPKNDASMVSIKVAMQDILEQLKA